MKAIVGIGDSWTQGQGGIPEEVWIDNKGDINKVDSEAEPLYLSYERSNSWVKVLEQEFFPDHISFNCGMRGYSNRGAVKNLYYYPPPTSHFKEGYLVFLTTAFSRFDLPCPNGPRLPHERRKLQTYFAFKPMDDPYRPGIKNFYEEAYSDHVGQQETLLALLEAQTYAKACNLEFFFGAGIEPIESLLLDPYNLAEQIDWSRNITPSGCFLEELWDLEKRENTVPHPKHPEGFNMPGKYIHYENHPSIEGYRYIAKRIRNHIFKHIRQS